MLYLTAFQTRHFGHFSHVVIRVAFITVLATGASGMSAHAQGSWQAMADSSARHAAQKDYARAYGVGLRAALIDKPASQSDSVWQAVMQIAYNLPDSVAVAASLKAVKYYFDHNQMKQAHSYVNQAIALGEQLGLPEYYLRGYVLLAKVAYRSQSTDKVAPLYKRVLADANGQRCTDCILESHLGLCDFYLMNGQLDSAGVSAQRALTYLRQLPNFKKNRYYPMTRLQLGRCAYVMGDLTTAIQELEESYLIAKAIMPNDLYMISIGYIYTDVISDINDNKALEATQTARRVLIRQPNYTQHPYYLLLLSNEIGMLRTLERNEEAVLLADSVLRHHSLTTIGQLKAFDSFLNQVTRTYITARREADLDRIVEKVQALLPIDGYGGANPGYLHGILGRYHQHKHNFADAVRHYKEEQRLDSLANGATYLNHSLKNRLAICQAEAGQRVDAYASFRQLVADFDHTIHYNLWLMSDAERDNFLRTSTVSNLHRSLLRHTNPQPAELGLAYEYKLLLQGVRLKTTRAINQLMHTRGQTDSSQNTIRELVSIRGQLADRNRRIDPVEKRQLQHTADSLERVMGGRATALNKAFKPIKWQTIRASLQPGEAAIEVIWYDNYSANGILPDSGFYSALLLRPEWSTPRLVHLPVPDGERLNSDAQEVPSAGTADDLTALYSTQNQKKLFEQFWQPIAAALGPVKRVYVTLDGSYLKLSLATLRNPRTLRYLTDDLDIIVLNSTQDIPEKPLPSMSRIVELVGHPTYSLVNNPEKNSPVTYQSVRRIRLRNGMIFDELPYTKTEVEQLAALVKTFRLTPRLRLDTAASESAFRHMKSPKILHVATHGYRRDSTRNAASQLLTCGLVLAGAADTTRRDTGADGLLTGYEASLLNLHGTELVVLSACESGAGNYFEGEGIHGLQRAFLLAGAQSVLMTLWKVNDQITQQLMTDFYRYWLSGLSKPQALRKAQFNLRKQYPEPYYWGAFVLLGQ